MTRLAIPLLLAAALLAPAAAPAQQPIAIAELRRTEPVSFNEEILPIFRRSCLACHDAKEASSELVLETPAGLIKGGDYGPSVVPGKSAESFILDVAAHREEPHMPPEDNDVAARDLTSQELGLIKLWIDQGAKADAAPALNLPEGWRPLPPGLHPIYSVDVTADGQFAACSRANQIFIYHVPTGQFITRLNDPALQEDSSDPRPGVAHLDSVQSLAFNREGDVLASGGFRNVKLWRFPRDVRRLELAAAAQTVTAVAATSDQGTLATGSEDGTIKLWDLQTGEPGATLEGHEGPVRAMRFSYDDARLFSASADKTVRVWSVAEGTLAGRIDTPTELTSLTTLVLPKPEEEEAAEESAEEPAEGEENEEESGPALIEQLATGGGDNLIRLWNVPDGLPEPLADAPAGANVLAKSPDSTVLAIAGTAGEIRVVQAGSGELIQTWQAHEGAIHAVRFAPTLEPPAEEPSPEGEEEATEAKPPVRRLATAGADGTVQVWNYDTAEELSVLRGTLAEVTALDFGPDGKHLVAGAADGSVTVWDLEAPPDEPLPTAPATPATVAVTSRDGKLLATGETVGGRPAVVVRELPTGKVLHTLLGHEAPVGALAFSADGTKLASGSDDKTARAWDLRDAKFPELARFAGHGGAVRGVAFSADATQVLSGAADKSVKLWTVADAEEVQDFAGHTGAVVAVAMASGNVPVSASADGTVRVWNAADGNQQRAISPQSPVTAMALRPDGNALAAATADNTIRVYQVSDGALVATLEGNGAAVHALAFSPDGTRLVSAAADDRAIVWKADDGRLLEIVPVEAGLAAAAYGPEISSIALADKSGVLRLQHLRFSLALGDMEEAVTGLAFHSNGQTIYAGCADGTVRGFTVSNGAQAFSANHAAPVHALALSPDGQRLASAGEDKQIKLWTASNGAPSNPPQLEGFAGPVRSVAFSADSARVIGGADAGELLVFSVQDGSLQQAVTAHTAAVQALVAFGGQGERIVSASPDDFIGSWQLLAVRQIAGHSQPVTSLATVPGEPPEIVSGSDDRTVRQWNSATGQQIRQLNHAGPVTAVAADPAGERIAATSSSKTIRLWNRSNGQQLAEMRGDLRAKALVAKLNRHKSAATAKVAAAKKTVEEAEQALPVKTKAQQDAAAALAAAEKEFEAKTTALAQVTSQKSQAEQAAIQAAAKAQAAAREMERLREIARALAEKAQTLQAKAAQAEAVAQADPDNEALAKTAENASMAAGGADAEAKAAESAAEAPAQAAATAGKAATDAATKAVAVSKPYIDAATAVAEAEAAQAAAEQARTFAQRDLEEATAAVPAAKEALAAAEAKLDQIDAELTAATEAEAESQQAVSAVAFSPDGRTLATGGDFGAVHTWDAETGKAVAAYVGHAAPIRALVYVSSDELVSGAADKTASVWNLNPNWQLERVIGDIADESTFADRVVAVDFSGDGRLLATGGGVPSRSGEVKIWNVADGSLVHAMPEAHTERVNAVAFSPDGSLLASAGADKYVKIFDVATGEQVMQLEGHTEHVLSVAWRAGGELLATSGGDGTIRIWNAKTGDRIRTIEGYEKHVTSVRYIGESQFLAAVSGDRLVRMHNSDNGGVQRNFAGATDYMYSVAVTGDPNTGVLVAGGHDGVLRIWNLGNGQEHHAIAQPGATPTAVADGGK